MVEKLSKEKTILFDNIIKSFSIALTNNALYKSGHPIFNSAVGSFKENLDKWFPAEEKLELGISPDNLLLNGSFVKEDNDLYGNVAGYLHKKGLMAILFKRGVQMPELLIFFSFLKDNKKGPMAHIVIKDLDYSSFMTGAKPAAAMDEKSIWQSLYSIGKELNKGQLPRSKIGFMTDFLKNPKKSAATLNKIYKEALSRLDDKSNAKEVGAVFLEISKYFEKHPAGIGDNAKKELMEITSNLDPDLVMSLFENKCAEDGLPDLADGLFKTFSDDMMASFMASLMKNWNNVNEKMIKLFNRLISEQDRSGSVLPMVADKLFQEKLLNRDSLSGLQNSIKDLFESHPDDRLVAQIYNLTVETFLEKDDGAKPALRRYIALVNEYKDFLKEDNLKKEKIKLLLNILWLETDAGNFKKMGDILVDSFSQLSEPKYINITKEAFKLLVEKLSLAQASDNKIASAVKGILDKIGEREIINRMASFIPGSTSATLNDIVYTLINAKHKDIVLDIVEKERNSEVRKNLLAALIMVKDADMIKKLFDKAGRQGLFKNKFLFDLVTLCGEFKVEESLERIKSLLECRYFIKTKAIRDLRVQSVLSLGMLGTGEAMEVVRKLADDPDNSVRVICKVVLET